MWATAGSTTNFGLMNLDNHVATFKGDGTTNFKSGSPGMNTVDNMWSTAGSTTNFGLMNLDNHVATFKGDGTTNFNGGGAGMNTVDNMWSTAGSTTNFGLLMNLVNNVNEYDAKKGSETMFDYSKGDPLAGTKITDMHKEAGASIDFNGATGTQEVGVTDKFQQGSQKRVDAAVKGDMNTDAGKQALATANANQFDTINDKFNAVNDQLTDAFGKSKLMVLLI